MKAKAKLSQLFLNYQTAHRALMRTLGNICRKVVAEYNSREENRAEIEKCRIHVANWFPDQKVIEIDIQIWITGGWPTMSAENANGISKTFREILDKYLICPRGFKICSYIQNVHTSSEDD